LIGVKQEGIVVLRRIADWLEKVSVAALAVGLFQDKMIWALCIAVVTLSGSLIMTKILIKNTGGRV
jgi:hypothetical protein